MYTVSSSMPNFTMKRGGLYLLAVTLSLAASETLYDEILFYNVTVIAEENVGNKVNFDVINVNFYNLNGGLSKNYSTLIIRQQEVYDVQYGAVCDLPWIQTVRFEDDKIEDINEGAFYNLPSLRVLSITDNPQLKQVKDGVFDCSSLQELYLYSNAIEYVHSNAFAGLPQLRVLGLDGNNLRRINHKWFAPTNYIFMILLGYNKLTKIREKDLISLQNVSYGSSLFDGVKLQFFHNRIRHLDRGVFRGIVVDDLNLSYNNLKNFERDIFESVISVRHVDLTGNNIKCEGEDQLAALLSVVCTVTKSDGWEKSCCTNANCTTV